MKVKDLLDDLESEDRTKEMLIVIHSDAEPTTLYLNSRMNMAQRQMAEQQRSNYLQIIQQQTGSFLQNTSAFGLQGC